jgi:PleD family two-component response regulator
MAAEKTSLSADEISALLKVSPLTVYEWVQKGLLHINLSDGKSHRFAMEDIQNFAKNNGLLLSQPGQGKLRILIIDDDRPASRKLVDLFETLSDSVEVMVAHSAFDAGGKLARFMPDVVLLDLLSPRNDGFEICRRIRSDYDTRHVRVLAMSDNDSPEHKQRILMSGAEQFFPKPVNNKRLLDTLGLCQSDNENCQTFYLEHYV